MISLENLSYAYPRAQTATLAGLSLDVKDGEIFGLLGPSGSGKSTTQKISMGLLQDFGGKALVFGQPVGSMGRKFFNRIGVSFELPTLYLRLTAMENLKLYAALYNGPTRDPLELLTLLGLEKDADKRVSDFSKGMKMRLNLCRALINDPDLLFLDEPTTGQDPARARLTRNLIRQLKEEGKTIFLTTHNMAEADEVCDRVGFLVKGRADIIDTPANLKQKHGQRVLEVTTTAPTDSERHTFPMEDLGANKTFLNLLQSGKINTMHTLEASLDDVFIKVAGSTDD
ncbi:MAG: ABC transporter ATP-binding protein [Aquisalinus sp.]|nr:ABC transporter ATP-binding protein [Aquisalinus sp.]